MAHLLRGQYLDQWKNDLKQIVKLQPNHISAYSLTVEPNTILYNQIHKGNISMPSENVDLQMFEYAQDYLNKNNYKQYEISNYAINGKECKHNLHYWNLNPYLAFGPSAHGYDGKIRWWNVSSLDKYMEKIKDGKSPISGQETLNNNEHFNEIIFNGIRTINGIQLNKLNSSDFNVCSFRPSTVFGKSPRLRCDIVFNNLVAAAYTSNKIIVKSDGTPQRPVIHIKDVCNALISGLKAPPELIAGKSFNVGIHNGNFSVRNLAEEVKKVIPNCEVNYLNEESDPRTYKVSFKKILNELKDYYKPSMNLKDGAEELIDFFKKINFTKNQFIGAQTNRIKKIEELINNNIINDQLEMNTKNGIYRAKN